MHNLLACSIMFRYDVTGCVKPLIAAFIKIGANKAGEFLYLSEKITHFSSQLKLCFHRTLKLNLPSNEN